jgi:phosphoribosyl-AMP cyclohydrolase
MGRKEVVLVKMEQVGGAACHTGFRSGFYRRVDPATGQVEEQGERVFDPKVVYGK